MNRIFLTSIIILLSFIIFTGCFKKEVTPRSPTLNKVELVYYKLYDNEDVFRPMIQQYQSQNPNIIIKYRKFTDAEEYFSLILNELAEGRGPDIMSVPNHWILSNSRKLIPAPTDYLTTADFESVFVSVASKDLLLEDPNDGERKVFGIPLSVDTLALFYNKDFYEDKIPERGRPAETWEIFRDDIFKITKADKSFERFELAGTAIGRADNITVAVDILYLMMIQHGINFYNTNFTKAQFAAQQTVAANGVTFSPAVDSLTLFTSFALANQKNYSWNEFIADSRTRTKEIDAFAVGKVASIFGYSYQYQNILDRIKDLRAAGIKTIDESVIRTALAPQLFDPKTANQKRDAFANYSVEVVARNTKNPKEAWDFLLFLSSKDNLTYYNQKTRRPTSRRDLIEEQKADPIFGVFAEQVGFAESLIIYDWEIYKRIFSAAIQSVIQTETPRQAVKNAEDAINAILPERGIYPEKDF